jgi:hypothetical protein
MVPPARLLLSLSGWRIDKEARTGLFSPVLTYIILILWDYNLFDLASKGPELLLAVRLIFQTTWRYC